MPEQMRREPQPVTKAEFVSDEAGLLNRMEWVRGEVGPFSDAGKRALLTNWGADQIIRITGPDVWREALAAYDAGRTG